ncbi:MAG: sulfatase-like hydrolase/transferase [Prevotella sp.]|nr:sulfatase-like hydrolase/transferase [Candidatus Prevotella equi]
MTYEFVLLYILGLVSSIITVPNLKGAHMYENAPWELFVDVTVVCLLLFLIPKALKTGKRSIPLRGIITTILFIFTYTLYIIDTFCFVKFGTTINPSMLLLMGETNGNEASEFLNTYVTADLLWSEVGIIMLVPLAHIIIVATKWRYNKKRHVMQKHNMRKRNINKKIYIRIAVAVIMSCLFAWSMSMCWENKTLFYKTMSHDTVGDVEHDLAVKPHVELYQPPYRLVFSIYCNRLASQQLDRLIAKTNDVQVDSCSVKSKNIVLIIGESCNLRHSQLYGYEKNNTPNQVLLEQTGMLTKMSDAIAPWNLTSFVFKHLMTTYCVGDTADWCDYPLFGQLFREAGYTVSFFTNQFLPQAKEAVYDFSGGFFINNPELTKKQFDVRNDRLHVFDEGLLKDYEESYTPHAIEEGKPTLTIFHMMGQHVNYRIRCPNSKKKWGRNDYPEEKDLTEKRKQTMADYDNATWYNDSVVNQIIERFKDKDAIIIYLSDHGEEVFPEGARHFHGRMHDANITRRLASEEFRIPMWFYCTEEYTRNHPETVAMIKAVKDKPYMSDAVSHLLLGLAGIHCPYYRADYDLLSTKYNDKRKRLLKHTVDYDTIK